MAFCLRRQLTVNEGVIMRHYSLSVEPPSLAAVPVFCAASPPPSNERGRELITVLFLPPGRIGTPTSEPDRNSRFMTGLKFFLTIPAPSLLQVYPDPPETMGNRSLTRTIEFVPCFSAWSRNKHATRNPEGWTVWGRTALLVTGRRSRPCHPLVPLAVTACWLWWTDH